jgi:hypothetical protein
MSIPSGCHASGGRRVAVKLRAQQRRDFDRSNDAPFMRHLAQDAAVMGDHAVGLVGTLTVGLMVVLIAASVTPLAVLGVAERG